jgi:casein kinase II subunit beta
MKWLREKPEDINELDEAKIFEDQRMGGRGDEIEVELEAEKKPVVATTSRKPGRKIAASKRRGANGGSPMDMDGVGNGG